MTTSAGPTTYQEQALRVLNDLPPFSPVLTLLLATLAKEDVSFARVAALIEKDTVLAGNVLRLVNSALYGFKGTINSVSHAISILGLVKLRNIALGFSVNRIWKSTRTAQGWSTARFNFHSVAAAILADLVAQRVPTAYPEGAFVSGLFHDLGKLLIAVSMPREYEEVMRTVQTGMGTPLECESQVLGINHAELSAAALKHWNLPAPVQRAVFFHHNPEHVPMAEYEGCQYHLAHIVRAASDTISQLGITLSEPADQTRSGASYSALEALGLGDSIQPIMTEFRNEYDAIRVIL